MKTQHLTSLIAIGALLPLTALGQANRETERERQERLRNQQQQPSGETQTPSGAGAIDRRPGHNSPHYAPGQGTTRDGAAGMSGDDSQYRQQQHSQQQYNQSPRVGAGASAALGASQIQRISSDEIDQRVTASSIIGKKVLDRDGQDVGRVRDIGLSSVAPQLSQQGSAQASAQRSEIGQQRGQAQTQGRAGAPAEVRTPGSQQGDTYTAGTGMGGATGQQQSGQWGASASASGESEARVFVQPDRALGVRGDLVAIPASQLRRDGDNFRIDMSRDQLRTLVAESPDRVTQNR
jgi:hypothetical protein